jgi:hypothetical protein
MWWALVRRHGCYVSERSAQSDAREALVVERFGEVAIAYLTVYEP